MSKVSGVSEQNQRPRAGGRPRYKPTDEQRSLVLRLVGEQKPQAAIAKEIGVSPVTLRKYFAAELGESVGEASSGQLDFDGTPPPPSTNAAEVGRPEFEPTWRQREDVKLCKADDWSDDRIARYIGVSRTTLVKHFAPELEQGADLLRIRVLRGLDLAASKGSSSAAEKLLRLPGMLGGARQLPTPDDPSTLPPAEEPLGKKELANRKAQTAHEGNSWSDLVRH